MYGIPKELEEFVTIDQIKLEDRVVSDDYQLEYNVNDDGHVAFVVSGNRGAKRGWTILPFTYGTEYGLAFDTREEALNYCYEKIKTYHKNNEKPEDIFDYSV